MPTLKRLFQLLSHISPTLRSEDLEVKSLM